MYHLCKNDPHVYHVCNVSTVCKHVVMCVRMHVFIYVRSLCVHVCMCVGHACMYVRTCLSVCMYVCMYVCICLLVGSHVYMYVMCAMVVCFHICM